MSSAILSPNMRHIISILLENEAGALSRVAGLFSARAYNIESLTVAPTEDASMSRMTLVTIGSADVVDTLIRQALPGIELAHVSVPPPAVPMKLDFQYFAIRKAGSAWDAINRARNLAVYVPAELVDARFELVIVLR